MFEEFIIHCMMYKLKKIYKYIFCNYNRNNKEFSKTFVSIKIFTKTSIFLIKKISLHHFRLSSIL